MKITRQWLREFVPTESSADELAERFTLLGAEVESVRKIEIPGGVLVAKVLSTAPDEKRSRITWCRVEAGEPSGPIEVACGAPNVRPGLLTALALPGTEFPGGFQVGIRKFGGRPSGGMLCSERELGLSDEHEGILELPPESEPGVPLAKALGGPDAVLDLDITPNRPDLLSVAGLAREIAAAEGLPLKLPSPVFPEEGPPISAETSVAVEDSELCGRYCARVVRGVKIGASPDRIKRRLEACGIRSINNVVDATNYVMLELGQPLHAFDLGRLSGGGVIVRLARPGEKIVAIDGVERNLDDRMLVIADRRGPVAVAGVMGGKESEVGEDTVDLFLESAHFNFSSVRRTSRSLLLSSESSRRFERIVDPNLPPRALDRLTELILETAGGKASAGMIDTRKEGFPRREVGFCPRRVSTFLGVDISAGEASRLLGGLGLEQSGAEGDQLLFLVPTARPDLERETDLAEETARLYGYNRIPESLPRRAIRYCPPRPRRRLEELSASTLCALGLDEAITYSFMDPRELELLGFPPDSPRRRAPRILNPVNKEQSLLRTSLLPGLLRVIRTNQSQKAPRIGVFEMGTVFRRGDQDSRPEESAALGIALAPGESAPYWGGGGRERDFFTLKGVIETLLDRLGVKDAVFSSVAEPPFQPGQTAALEIAGRRVGLLGRLDEPVLAAAAITGPVLGAELDLEILFNAADLTRSYRALETYPGVERDIALVIGAETSFAEVAAAVAASRPEILESFQLFDVYSGEQVPDGKKSLAIRLRYRSKLGTLDENTVSAAHAGLVDNLRASLGGELR